MSVRAKFKVDKKSETLYGFEFVLTPVHGDSPENKTFFKYTPSGSINIAVVNPEVGDQFVLGKEYYVDFTLASED